MIIKIAFILESCIFALVTSFWVLNNILAEYSAMSGNMNNLFLGCIIFLTSIILYLILSSMAINLCSAARSWAYDDKISKWDGEKRLKFALVCPFVVIPFLCWYLLLGTVHKLFNIS